MKRFRIGQLGCYLILSATFLLIAPPVKSEPLPLVSSTSRKASVPTESSVEIRRPHPEAKASYEPRDKVELDEDATLEAFVDELTWDSAQELLRRKLVQLKGRLLEGSKADEDGGDETLEGSIRKRFWEFIQGQAGRSDASLGTRFASKVKEAGGLFEDLERVKEKANFKTKVEAIRKEMVEPVWDRYIKALDTALEEMLAEPPTSGEVKPVELQTLESLYDPPITGVSTPGELGFDDHSNATLMSGLSLMDLVVIERCPETEREFSMNCFCTKAKQWACPPGFFCLTPGAPRLCPLGFYCPENTFQPSFCCGGYYCPASNVTRLCPEGQYCQEGSISPRPCYFGHCPAGSKTIRKYEVFVIFLCFLVVVWIFQCLRRRRLAQLRHANTAALRAASIGSGSAATACGWLSRGSGGIRFEIEFEDLGLRLANGAEVMRGVTGRLLPGRACAILGPSGAGKTTLVSLLTGKVTKTCGLVRVNGKLRTLAAYRKLVGVVPQDDIMLRNLTVHEILSHAAGLRLPASWSASQRTAKTYEIIRYLGLSEVMHQVVGDEEERGISGGQRKRVNIGMELVAEPSVLFLDEPTSGLDSSTAVGMCALLSRVATEHGLTVAAVIHSPSPAAFACFDDLILLGAGGRLLYQGPRIGACDYFESLGFSKPDFVTPADYILDIASGKAKSKLLPETPTNFLVEAWDLYYNAQRLEKAFDLTGFLASHKATGTYLQAGQGFQVSEAESDIAPLLVPFDDNEKYRPTSISKRLGYRWRQFTRDTLVPLLKSFGLLFLELCGWGHSVALEIQRTFFKWGGEHRPTPSPLTIFKLCFGRALTQMFRPPMGFVLDQLLHLGCGLFISIAAQNSVFLGPLPEIICNVTPLPLYVKCKRPVVDQAAQIGNFMSWGIGFAGIAVGAGTFGNERGVFWRECSWGMPALPYFVAKVLADLPRLLVAALMFTLALVAVYPNAAPFHQLYGIVAALYLWGFSAGYLISALVRKEKAPLVGVAFALFWALVFSGVQPTLREIEAAWGPHVRWLWDISAPRWAIGAFYIAETESEARGYLDPAKVGRHWFGYHQDAFLKNLSNVLVIALGWQLLAFMAFKLCNRDKMR